MLNCLNVEVNYAHRQPDRSRVLTMGCKTGTLLLCMAHWCIDKRWGNRHGANDVKIENA